MKTEILLKEIHPLIAQAQSVRIETSKDMVEATVLLSTVNKKLDAITAEKEKVTKPLNEALKVERGRWKPLEDILTGAISALRVTISKYQTEEKRRADAEKAKIAARVGDGKGKLQPMTAVEKIRAVDTPEEKVETTMGGLTFRSVDTLVIDDAVLVPRKYLVIDERAVLSDLKKGVLIPGVHIDVIQQPVNRR